MSNEETRIKRERGVVVSDKMDKSIVVAVTNVRKHPTYGKYMERGSKFMVHDPENRAREGDLVEIEACRPLSRRKRWRLVRVVRRGFEVTESSLTEQAPQAPTSGAKTI